MGYLAFHRLLVAVVVASLAAVACRKQDPTGPLHWQNGAPGLDYALTQTRADGDHVAAAVHLVRVDVRTLALQVVTAAEMGRTLAAAPDFRERSGGLAAINGGYFDPQYRPLGLLVSQGRELAHIRQVDHGIFAIAGGKASIEHARTWHAPTDLDFAIECGPRLLVHGIPPHFRREDVARRVALGIDQRGSVVLAVSASAVTLAQFAELLQTPVERGGPGLTDALNLDGGSSAMLDLAAGPLRVAVASAVEVPIGVAVVPRFAVRAP